MWNFFDGTGHPFHMTEQAADQWSHGIDSATPRRPIEKAAHRHRNFVTKVYRFILMQNALYISALRFRAGCEICL
jgi:hypothetical protein